MGASKKYLYIALGSIFLVLGAIGVFVPLLPTTPFWLLTCWFYIRSSERLYNRVMRNRYFGSYIKAYMVDKSIPLGSKIFSVGLMWISIILSCVFLVDKWWIHLILFVITVGVTWHILSFPTRKSDGTNNL